MLVTGNIVLVVTHVILESLCFSTSSPPTTDGETVVSSPLEVRRLLPSLLDLNEPFIFFVLSNVDDDDDDDEDDDDHRSRTSSGMTPNTGSNT